MRARFKGDPERNNEGPEAIEAFGLSFRKGAWVGVDHLDPVSMRKLLGNSHFETDGGKVAAAPAPTPTPAAPVADEIPADWQQAHHKTRVKWARGLGATVANVQEADAFLAERMAPKVAPEPVAAPAPSIADPDPGSDDDWSDLDP